VDHTEDNGREVSGEMDHMGYPIRHKGGCKIREKHEKTFLGIIRAIMLDLSNSVAEGINNKIKTAFKRS